jgi:hypothetical protein
VLGLVLLLALLGLSFSSFGSALLCKALLLCVPGCIAECALDIGLARRSVLTILLSTKGLVTGRSDQGTVLGIVLGLRNLEHSLNIPACETPCVHEGQDTVAVLVARECPEHGYECKLVIKVLDAIGLGSGQSSSDNSDGVWAKLFDTS